MAFIGEHSPRNNSDNRAGDFRPEVDSLRPQTSELNLVTDRPVTVDEKDAVFHGPRDGRRLKTRPNDISSGYCRFDLFPHVNARGIGDWLKEGDQQSENN